MRFASVALGMIALGCLAFRVSLGAAEKKQLPPLNEQVLKFAEANLGKQVGNGECWTLGDEALAAAKAKRPAEGDNWTRFGRSLKADEKFLPGDIAWFEKARFEAKSGAVADAPDHIAIVTQVNGTKFEVLHQNWNGQKKVHRGSFNLAEKKRGTVTFFRPENP